MPRCEVCNTEINLRNPVNGEIIDCPECGIDLEVLGNSLIALQLGPSEE